MDPIGYPFEKLADDGAAMRFRFHGNAGALGQAAFFGAIAARLAFGGVPVGPWFPVWSSVPIYACRGVAILPRWPCRGRT